MTTITVTAEHIAEGKPDNCRDCPVALAILAAMPDARRVSVMQSLEGRTYTQIRVIPDSTRPANRTTLEADLPAEVARFVRAFDHGEPVEPFSFTVDIPEAAA
jgi:hypothetical protein